MSLTTHRVLQAIHPILRSWILMESVGLPASRNPSALHINFIYWRVSLLVPVRYRRSVEDRR
jgi:hypothetical protein